MITRLLLGRLIVSLGGQSRDDIERRLDAVLIQQGYRELVLITQAVVECHRDRRCPVTLELRDLYRPGALSGTTLGGVQCGRRCK